MTTPDPLTFRRERLGPLDCLVLDGGNSPTIPVFILHGYGANAEDLAGLAPAYVQSLGDQAKHFRFVFPNAPQSLEPLGMPGGWAWWPINMAGLMEAIEAKRFDQLHDQTPPGLSEASAAVSETMNIVFRQMGLDGLAGDPDEPSREAPYVIGGFSQGAMLAAEMSIVRTAVPPSLLLLYSGTLIRQNKWKPKLERLNRCRVFQSHGTADPILPLSSATKLRDLIASRSIDLDFVSFPGGHTIPPEAISKTVQMLAGVAPSD